MSLRIMNIGFKSDLEPSSKLIYLSLADFANDKGECFPSKYKIAQKASVSKSTVKYYLKAFENLNIITTEQLFRKNGSKSSLQYKINIESNNLKRSIVKAEYQKIRKIKSHNVTIIQNGKKKQVKTKLNVPQQNKNCNPLESSYFNHQSLDEEEVSKYFEDFYKYLNSIGVKAIKSEIMHRNRIKANLLKGHVSTMNNFSDFMSSVTTGRNIDLQTKTFASSTHSFLSTKNSCQKT